MRRKGIRKGLVRRMEEVLRETRSRADGEIGEDFWTARRVRQECPLSLLLFNILIADLEKVVGKVKWES